MSYGHKEDKGKNPLLNDWTTLDPLEDFKSFLRVTDNPIGKLPPEAQVAFEDVFFAGMAAGISRASDFVADNNNTGKNAILLKMLELNVKLYGHVSQSKHPTQSS